MNSLKQLIKEFRLEIENKLSLRSDDFGHDCHKLLLAESEALQLIGEKSIKLIDAVEVLVDGLEFYADGAGLILEREQMFSDDYIAYENDFRRDTPLHLEKPVGEYARKALQLAEEKVKGEHD